MADYFEKHSSSEYFFVLDDYEGPLDLLLELIREKNKDIADIKISEITDQYLQYMQGIDSVDLDKASDFIAMAATLLEIKSKSVLPKPEEEVEEEDNPEERLRRQLMEYKLFKEKAEEIKKHETLNRFYVDPQFSESDAIITIKDFNMTKLLEAYATLLLRFSNEKESVGTKKIQKDRFTVADKIVFVSKLLEHKRRVRFSELFDADYTKSEIINTFLALLELLKRQMATAVQDEWQEDILIEFKENEEDLSNLEVDSLDELN